MAQWSLRSSRLRAQVKLHNMGKRQRSPVVSSLFLLEASKLGGLHLIMRGRSVRAQIYSDIFMRVCDEVYQSRALVVSRVITSWLSSSSPDSKKAIRRRHHSTVVPWSLNLYWKITISTLHQWLLDGSRGALYIKKYRKIFLAIASRCMIVIFACVLMKDEWTASCLAGLIRPELRKLKQ